MSSQGEHLVIVGAGIIGITIAHQLLLQDADENNFNKITFVANHFPHDQPLSHDYTSPWAGAHFRPFPHKKDTYESDKRESGYTRVTYKFFQDLVKTHPESTIEFMMGVDWLEDPTPEYENLGPGYQNDGILTFTKLPKEQLPKGIQFGCEYTTYCLNAPKYLNFLVDQIKKVSLDKNIELNWVRTKGPLSSLKQVRSLLPDGDKLLYMINATGQGLQYDGGLDPASYPIRGQTLLVNAPEDPNKIKFAHETVTHQGKDGSWTFVIKRPTPKQDPDEKEFPQYILGGTKQPGATDSTIRNEDTEGLISRARVLYPELVSPEGNIDIVKVNVGFRPGRKGGSRVECERIDGLKIVHAYGIAGMGYEASVGMSQHVLQLLHECT